MSALNPLFCNSEGQYLYWAGAPDAYGEHTEVVFTYASGLHDAQTHFSSRYRAIEDATVMTSEHLTWGRVVASAAQWSARSGDAQVLAVCLNAYKTEGHQPPTVFLLNAAEKGNIACFDVLRPHFTLAFMGDDGRNELAQSIGRGGCVDILTRVARYLSPAHFEQALEHASITQQEQLVAVLIEHCAAHNVLVRMQNTHTEDKYRVLEHCLNTRQNTLIRTTLADTLSPARNRRKI